MRRLLVVAALSIALGGCGVAATVSAHNDVLVSKAAYKACLAQHPTDVGECEGPRAAYEADLAAYQALPRAVMGGGPGAEWLHGQMLQSQIQAQQSQDFVNQSQANFWSMVNSQQQSQANFWGMVDAMESGPR